MADHDDPRVDRRYLRTVGGVTLVGVVHDHPASVARVETVVEALAPAVLALELPDLAVPLYERSRPGDEMSAAVAAAGDARVVGVDAPGRGASRALVGAALGHAGSADSSAPRATLRERLGAVAGAVAGLARVTRDAVEARLAASRGATARVTPAVEHEVDRGAAPARQADDERRHLARSRALLAAVERPAGERLLDRVRERTMAARLRALAGEGAVVAVVGLAHLDAVADRLGGE